MQILIEIGHFELAKMLIRNLLVSIRSVETYSFSEAMFVRPLDLN